MLRSWGGVYLHSFARRKKNNMRISIDNKREFSYVLHQFLTVKGMKWCGTSGNRFTVDSLNTALIPTFAWSALPLSVQWRHHRSCCIVIPEIVCAFLVPLNLKIDRPICCEFYTILNARSTRQLDAGPTRVLRNSHWLHRDQPCGRALADCSSRWDRSRRKWIELVQVLGVRPCAVQSQRCRLPT